MNTWKHWNNNKKLHWDDLRKSQIELIWNETILLVVPAQKWKQNRTYILCSPRFRSPFAALFLIWRDLICTIPSFIHSWLMASSGFIRVSGFQLKSKWFYMGLWLMTLWKLLMWEVFKQRRGYKQFFQNYFISQLKLKCEITAMKYRT